MTDLLNAALAKEAEGGNELLAREEDRLAAERVLDALLRERISGVPPMGEADGDQSVGGRAGLRRRAESLRRRAQKELSREAAEAELQGILDNLKKTTKSFSIRKSGMALLVTNARGDTLFDVDNGKITTQRYMNVASGSKLVAGITLLKCIDDTPTLSLESTTGEILGWKGKNKDLTIDILGAFAAGQIDGLSATAFAACQLDMFKTMQQCVNDHLRNADFTGPGTNRYEPLGAAHHIVAAMCEKASGRSFVSWFDELKATLGVKSDSFMFSCPACWSSFTRSLFGNQNPSLAAGLNANAKELTKFLRLVVNKGRHNGKRIIDAALIERMGRNPYSSKGNQITNIDYGFFSQPFCTEGGRMETSFQSGRCSKIGHSGAWGLHMWVDLNLGYSAVLIMNADTVETIQAVQTSWDGTTAIQNVLTRVKLPAEGWAKERSQRSPTRNSKTNKGCQCLASWSHWGKKYSACSKTPDSSKPWCRVDRNSCKGWTNWFNPWDYCASEWAN